MVPQRQVVLRQRSNAEDCGVRVKLLALALSTFGFPGIAADLDARAATLPQTVSAPSDPATPIYMAIRLNGVGQILVMAVLLDESSQQLWLTDRDLRRLRLRTPQSASPRLVDGQRFHRLTDIVGASFEYDAPGQGVSIQVPATAFDNDQFLTNASTPVLQVAKRRLATYATYDVYTERSGSKNKAGGVFDIETSLPWGVLSATQFVTHGADLQSVVHTRARRLDTTFTVDYPERLLSVRVGDFIANSANASSPVRMGGLQVASNFTVRPGFVTYPTTTIQGQATLPSVAEVFVNGISGGPQNVAPGPFSIGNVAAISGLGEITLVVRDVLGREQVVVSSFYGSSQLLAPGISEYSLSLGKLRYNYATESNDYRNNLASAFWRYGLTPQFTPALNVDISKRVSNAGIGATFLIPRFAEANASAAASRADVLGTTAQTPDVAATKSGYSVLLGIDRRTKSYGIGARIRYASPFYRTIDDGYAELEGLPSRQLRREFNAYASVSAGEFGSLTANFLSQVKATRAGQLATGVSGIVSGITDTRVLALGYTTSLGQYGQISFGASKSMERNNREPANRTVFINYFLPLDSRHSVGASSSRTESAYRSETDGKTTNRNTQTSNLLTVQRSLSEGEDFGYRAQVGDQSLLRLEGRQATRAATLGIDYAQTRGSRGVRASVSGALAMVDGEVFAGRRIPDSFAVVDTGGFSQVRVYLDNILIGRTNDSGRLFIPSIRSYQRHTVSIEPTDLPLSAEVDEVKLELVTPRSSGTAIKFPVRRADSAQVRLMDELGAAIPAGAVATHGTRTFPVAQDGELFLQGLESFNEISVRLGEKSCRVRIPFLASSQIIPHLGSYVCPLK